MKKYILRTTLIASLVFISLPSLASAVTIPVGSSIQAAINANPNGTVFNLPAGVWTNQVISPKLGNQFIGDPSGGTILTGSNTTNVLYSSWGNVPLNVTWENIVVERYGSDAPNCELGAIHWTNAWTFRNATFRFNNCTGLVVGKDNQVIGGRYNDNRFAGILGSGSERTIIWGAEIARNNTRHDNPEWLAAGVKLHGANGAQFINNYVHDNYGPGLWCDIRCSNGLIEGNTVINNYAQGIMYEISNGTTIIRNNVVNDNATTLLGRPQIYVSSSNGVEVYGNNIKSTGSGAAILMISEARGADQTIVANNSFHNNIITMTNGNSRYGFANWSGGSVGGGNSSNNNSFYVTNTGNSVFYWNTAGGATFASYRSSSGQDANSTIQVGNASVPGNTQGCPALTGCGGTPPPPPPTPPHLPPPALP